MLMFIYLRPTAIDGGTDIKEILRLETYTRYGE